MQNGFNEFTHPTGTSRFHVLRHPNELTAGEACEPELAVGPQQQGDGVENRNLQTTKMDPMLGSCFGFVKWRGFWTW